MAVAFDKLIGSSATNTASSPTATLTTTSAAANGTKIIAGVSWPSGVTLSSVSDNSGLGYSWTVAVPGDTDLTISHGIAWVDAPNGLPSGTVITFTFSANTTGFDREAVSYTGLKTGAHLLKATANTSGTTWSSGNISVTAGDLMYGRSYTLASATSTPGGNNVERADYGEAGQPSATTLVEQIPGSTGTLTANGTWTSAFGGPTTALTFAAAPAAAVTTPTPPLPRAFQEQGRIYSGEQTGFQPLAFQIPDPGRAFQEGMRLGEPKAFQDQAFQIPDPDVAFQVEAFDDSSAFQMSVVAFEEPTAWQGDAFQEYYRPTGGFYLDHFIRTLQAVNRAGVF